MSESFKTCLFGGFDKEDVIKFIEQQSEKHRIELDSIQRDNEVLREAVSRMERERGVFMPKAQEQEAATGRVQALEQELEQLRCELASVRQENESLRVPAQEYEKLKDHIAEIEISAHRRTEEFRAETIRKIRDVINAQRAWCSEERGHYNCLNSETLEKLRQAAMMVENNSDANFERMMEGLQRIEDSLE